MIRIASDKVVEIAAHDPETIERDLTTAVDIVLQAAMADPGHGILVTQHSYTSYTVAVSMDVPFGLTRERREV